MKCTECKHYTMRNDLDMARNLYGNCAHLKPWEYRSALKDHDCVKFEKSDEETIQARESYVIKRLQKMREIVNMRIPLAGGLE